MQQIRFEYCVDYKKSESAIVDGQSGRSANRMQKCLMYIEGYSFESIKGESIFENFQKLFRLIFLRIPNGSTVDGSETDSNESNYFSNKKLSLKISIMSMNHMIDENIAWEMYVGSYWFGSGSKRSNEDEICRNTEILRTGNPGECPRLANSMGATHKSMYWEWLYQGLETKEITSSLDPTLKTIQISSKMLLCVISHFINSNPKALFRFASLWN